MQHGDQIAFRVEAEVHLGGYDRVYVKDDNVEIMVGRETERYVGV